ncbi:hypothetical protein [uncultured Desulfuromonas sp.]|uniref:hypothetical protein n=1 Tax=uncultured Desulfuromonas sp. TaxID=181013 RepID=UPI002635F0C4|nr:hypothetical protein [uncultured Desulfuromonas sp.]
MSEDTTGFTPPKPDLDWSQVRETVLMLNLAVAQIEKAMKEGDESVDHLADTFTSLAGSIQAIDSAAENLQDTDEKRAILANVQPLAKQVNKAIIAFQFYDRLTQRLSHASNSLGALGTLVGDPVRLYSPYEWHGLQAMIQSKYTIDGDRKMFEAIHSGATVEDALALADLHPQKSAQEGDIELF